MVRTIPVIFGIALACVGCGRDVADERASASYEPTLEGAAALAAEFDQLLGDPGNLFITPTQSRQVRELTDLQFTSRRGGRETLCVLLASGSWQESLWFPDVAEQFLDRVENGPDWSGDALTLSGVLNLANQTSHPTLRRQAAVVLAAVDAPKARTILLAEYGRVRVALVGQGQPTVAPALEALGVEAPEELTSLEAARVVLDESGINMAGVNDSHLAAAADVYNRLLNKLANEKEFEALAAMRDSERASGMLLMLYRQELQDPTPKFTEPSLDWLE